MKEPGKKEKLEDAEIGRAGLLAGRSPRIATTKSFD